MMTSSVPHHRNYLVHVAERVEDWMAVQDAIYEEEKEEIARKKALENLPQDMIRPPTPEAVGGKKGRVKSPKKGEISKIPQLEMLNIKFTESCWKTTNIWNFKVFIKTN